LDELTGSSRQRCSGIASYDLPILYDDDRISINVISPGGNEYPRNYWEVISNNFTGHGTRAEWRVANEDGKQVPKAFIVQGDAFENPDNPEEFTSYLAVAKISPKQTFVTDKIGPEPKQHDLALRTADASAVKPYLSASAAAPSSDVKETYASAAKFLKCDIWGATMFALDLPPFNREHEEGASAEPVLVGPLPQVISQVWNKQLHVDPQDHSGRLYSFCLTTDRAVYEMSLVSRSETEGTWLSLKEFASLSKCKEDITETGAAAQIVSFPSAPLSQNCPFLKLGASRDQVTKHLGPAHVERGQNLYYLQLDTPDERKSCSAWLDADEPSCCFPGMSLAFTDGRLTEIAIHDGHGEGPPCDEQPSKDGDK
jgi:hypothetical protein